MPAISDLCRDRAQGVANYLQPVDRRACEFIAGTLNLF
jgi:hypothetical protein